MARKAIVIVDPSTDSQTEFGPLYARGLVGSHNGFFYNEGGAVVSVVIYDPAAFDEIDANPLLTRLPSVNDPTPDAVKQSHIDKLHPHAKNSLKSKGKIDNDHKLKGNMSARELVQHLHDLYKDCTKHLHPDF